MPLFYVLVTLNTVPTQSSRGFNELKEAMEYAKKFIGAEKATVYGWLI